MKILLEMFVFVHLDKIGKAAFPLLAYNVIGCNQVDGLDAVGEDNREADFL